MIEDCPCENYPNCDCKVCWDFDSLLDNTSFELRRKVERMCKWHDDKQKWPIYPPPKPAYIQ